MECGDLIKRKFCFLFMVVLMMFSKVQAQKFPLKFGASLSASSSGSGFGAIYSPGFYIYKGNTLFEFALNIQKREYNVSGGQITFEYRVFDGETDYDPDALRLWELFFFVHARGNFNALLGNYQLQVERKISPRSATDFSSLRFDAAEGYAGFGFKLKIESRLKWVNAVGLGGWVTFRGPNNIYRDYNSMSLWLKTGLSYNFSD